MLKKDIDSQRRIDVLLAEYNSQRAELFNHLTHFRQVQILVLGSLSIALPLLIVQIINLSPQILVSLLWFLVMIYSVTSMNMTGLQFSIDVMGFYIHTHIEPELNFLLPAKKDERRLLGWETALRNFRSKPVILLVNVIGTIGTLLLLILPAGTFLIVAEYVVALPSFSLNALSGVIPSSLNILRWFAWGVYVISLIGWISTVFIQLFEFQLVRKNNAN
jgi:hypothetical protein